AEPGVGSAAAERGAQPVEPRVDARPVLAGRAGQRDQAPGLAVARDQPQLQRRPLDAAALAHSAAVEADEVGALRREPAGAGLADARRGPHRVERRPEAFPETLCHQPSAPNTSTPSNRQAGAECPTRITCPG